VNGFPVEGVAEHEGNVLFVAKAGEPVPGEHALTGHSEAVAEGSDRLEKGGGVGGEGLGEGGLARGVEEVHRESSGVQIDAAVESVGLVVEPHHGPPRNRGLVAGNSSLPVAKRP
jgi:hypothetical protein